MLTYKHAIWMLVKMRSCHLWNYTRSACRFDNSRPMKLGSWPRYEQHSERDTWCYSELLSQNIRQFSCHNMSWESSEQILYLFCYNRYCTLNFQFRYSGLMFVQIKHDWWSFRFALSYIVCYMLLSILVIFNSVAVSMKRYNKQIIK